MKREVGRDPSGQALVASDEAPAGLHPSGFDPSRISAGYDRRADVFYLSLFEPPRPAITREAELTALVRFDPDTREIVGVTFVDFFEQCNAIAMETRRAETTGSVAKP